MPELCARRENEPAEREGTLNRGGQVLSWIYVCCVLTTSPERRHVLLWGTEAFFSGSATHFNTIGWTYKYCTVLNKMLCEASHVHGLKVCPTFLSLSLSLRVEGKMDFNATTSLQNKLVSLPTDKSTSLSTHGSHSDTQSSPQRLLWNDK